jgi:mono/diheme cytochrome c family protein
MDKRMFYLVVALLVFSVIGLAACGGREAEQTVVETGPVGEVEEPVAETGSGGEAEEAVAETGSGGDVQAGQQLFVSSCSSCHGPEGRGVPGLGNDLTTSDFVAGLSDSELVAFINEGRPPDHPDNTTGIAMPPKGGNPSLSDEDLADIVAYIRSIHS